jgi:acetylornithine deacetylase/succinyl-diaminopimelate desuccinylase-like protein
MNHDARAWAEGHRQFFEERLRTLVELPTVSAHPERMPDIERCAEEAACLIRHFGGTAEIWRSGGKPRPRHVQPGRPSCGADLQPHDVQPPTSRVEGRTFRLRIDATLSQPGTTDDKGPALTCLLAVARRAAGSAPLTSSGSSRSQPGFCTCWSTPRR